MVNAAKKLSVNCAPRVDHERQCTHNFLEPFDHLESRNMHALFSPVAAFS